MIFIEQKRRHCVVVPVADTIRWKELYYSSVCEYQDKKNMFVPGVSAESRTQCGVLFFCSATTCINVTAACWVCVVNPAGGSMMRVTARRWRRCLHTMLGRGCWTSSTRPYLIISSGTQTAITMRASRTTVAPACWSCSTTPRGQRRHEGF